MLIRLPRAASKGELAHDGACQAVTGLIAPALPRQLRVMGLYNLHEMSLVLLFRDLRPVIDPTPTWADHYSVLGDVTIGAGSSIWFGTVNGMARRCPVRIGAQTSIQDNSVIHVTNDVNGTTVGSRVTVGHRVILHACDVEDDYLIGMGAIILDNARVGRGSVVGAGALVTPGTIIPPGSFVLGSPARVKRAVEDRERGWIASSAAHYVELAAVYRAEARSRESAIAPAPAARWPGGEQSLGGSVGPRDATSVVRSVMGALCGLCGLAVVATLAIVAVAPADAGARLQDGRADQGREVRRTTRCGSRPRLGLVKVYDTARSPR